MRLAHGDLSTLLAAGGTLLLVTAALVAGYFDRRRRLRRLGADPALRRTVRSRTPALRAIKGVLLLLALAGLLFALLRPQHGGREQLVRQFGLDVVVAVDFSKSMLAEDVAPSRIRRVRMEIDRLLGDLDGRGEGALAGNRVGAVAFAGDAIAFPVSTDLAIASTFFRNFDPASMEPPGTAIGRALRKAQLLLENADPKTKEGPELPAALRPEREVRSRLVVLFTDGEDHEGDPVAAARALEGIEARVLVVQVGELGGTTIPLRDPDTGEVRLHYSPSGELATTEITPQTEEALRAIASPRDPKAPDGDRFLYRLGAAGSVVGSILRDIRSLSRSEIEARKVTLYDELYWIPLLPAALLLALEAALPPGWERRRRNLGTPPPRRNPAGGEPRA